MTILLSKTLYNLDTKNKVRQWSISVTSNPDDTATITVSQGLKDGSLTDRATHITKGKNIGKANETTPAEQAVSEAESKIAKQRDRGYCDEAPTSQGQNGMGFIKPMLALASDKVKGEVDWSEYFVQPKLDGFRMLARFSDGAWQLYTRQGKAISVPHIEEALGELHELCNVEDTEGVMWPYFKDGHTLDGELYCHDLTFQQISSAAKKAGENTLKLKYHIYDLLDDVAGPYDHRYGEILGFGGKVESVEVVTTTKLGTDNPSKQWDELHAYWISQGYEGTIARHAGSIYQPAGRDKRMIKRKDFHDEEFVIAGIDRTIKPAPIVGDSELYAEEAKVTLGDQAYAYQAQFLCRTFDGKEFGASLEGGVLSRARLYVADDSEYIGKLATCKYFEMTDDGIPRHPIARRRDEL